MSGKLVIIVIIALTAGGYNFAQMNPLQTDSQPSSYNITDQQYLRVDSLRRAIFRVNALQALSVVVSFGNIASTKGEDGYRRNTTKPLDPGIYHHQFIIDGFAAADTATETLFRSGNLRSNIEVPAEDYDFYVPKNVPHEAFEKAEIKYVYYDSPDTTREWLRWRRDLREFVPLLFKD